VNSVLFRLRLVATSDSSFSALTQTQQTTSKNSARACCRRAVGRCDDESMERYSSVQARSHTDCFISLSSYQQQEAHTLRGTARRGGANWAVAQGLHKTTAKHYYPRKHKILFWSVNSIVTCIHYTRFMMSHYLSNSL